MKSGNILLRGLAVFAAYCVIQMIAGLLVPMNIPAAPHTLQWMLLMNVVVVAALMVVALRVEWRGWRLGIVVVALPLAITAVNLLEGVVFLKAPHPDWARIFLYNLISSALVVPVWTLLFGRQQNSLAHHFHPIQSQSRAQRAWKFAVSDLLYLVLYFGTGAIIFPYVKDFYTVQQLPPLGGIIALQLLIRGPLFILLCLCMTRMLGLSRLNGALVVGLVFTLLSGVAPLLLPNPYFPDSVRWVHFCEVTSENFIFGAIVAWLWGPPEPLREMAATQLA
jgi:hypothetical protein